MAEAYYLTESDREILKRVVERERKRSGNQQNLPDSAAPGDADTAPDVFVAYTGTTGIPARVGTTLGVAELTLYKQLNPATSPPTLVTLGITRRIHNLSTDAVDAGEYVLVARAKDGTWFIASTGGTAGNIDTGTAGCGTQIFYTYRYRCELQDAMGVGTADDVYALYEYRTLHVLTVDENGCLEHTTFGEERVGAVACCDPGCADAEDTGTGTAGGFEDTGTGTGVLETGCCPDNGVPGTLTVEGTFTCPTTGQVCDCEDFSITITYGQLDQLLYGASPAQTVWAGEKLLACGLRIRIELSCGNVICDPDDTWTGNVAFYVGSSTTPCYVGPSDSCSLSTNCDPFEVQMVLGCTEDISNDCTDICDHPSTKIGVTVVIGE